MCNLQKVEQKEREDEAAGIHKHAGGGDGKGKARPKKMPMAETRPSPMGIRVAPCIDAALRAKVEAAAAKKLKAKVLMHLLILIKHLQCSVVNHCTAWGSV